MKQVGTLQPPHHRTESAHGSEAPAGIDVPGACFAPQCFPLALPLSSLSPCPGITHPCPATALTGEDEEPETCLERGAQHAGLWAGCLKPVKSKVI